MKKHYTLLLMAMAGLIISCSQAKTAEKTNEPVMASNVPKDSLRLENTATKVQEPGKPETEGKEKEDASLDGVWIHEEDDKAFITIDGSNWISGYEGIEISGEDKYQVTKVDKLPQFVDPQVETEFLVLTNKSDTVYYELNGVTKETLSLTWYPGMKTHVYIKKK
jgi:hypothetical protein